MTSASRLRPRPLPLSPSRTLSIIPSAAHYARCLVATTLRLDTADDRRLQWRLPSLGSCNRIEYQNVLTPGFTSGPSRPLHRMTVTLMPLRDPPLPLGSRPRSRRPALLLSAGYVA